MLRTQPHFIQPFQKALCLCAIGGLLCFGLSTTVHANKSKVKPIPAYQQLIDSNALQNIQNSKRCPSPHKPIPIKTKQDIENLNKILQKSTKNTCHVVAVLDPSIRIPNPVIKITKQNFNWLNTLVMEAMKTNKTVSVNNIPQKMTQQTFNTLNKVTACTGNNGKPFVITDPLKKLSKCL